MMDPTPIGVVFDKDPNKRGNINFGRLRFVQVNPFGHEGKLDKHTNDWQCALKTRFAKPTSFVFLVLSKPGMWQNRSDYFILGP